VPLIVVLAASYFLHEDLGTDALIVALLLGSLSAWLVNIRHMVDTGRALAEGSTGALLAIGNTAAVVGFGAVAKAAPAFGVAVHWVTHLPGDPLISASLAVTLIAGMTGSASGGQVIALPILAPHFLGLGVNPEQLHRAVALSSGVLDALPHNGYLVTTIRAICKETHAAAYPACFAVAVVVTGVGLILCLALFKLGIT
jgi:H+/gluconate symporter-like permease